VDLRPRAVVKGLVAFPSTGRAKFAELIRAFAVRAAENFIVNLGLVWFRLGSGIRKRSRGLRRRNERLKDYLRKQLVFGSFTVITPFTIRVHLL
jgi:ubiquinone biosynthesis protein UbiJ